MSRRTPIRAFGRGFWEVSMPERGLALTFGALLLIGFAGVFGLTNTKPADIRNLLLGRGPFITASPSPLPATPEISRTPAAKHRSRRAEPARLASMPPPTVLDIPVQIPAALRESDVRPSMSRAELIERFGAPDLGAAWSDAGKLNEKLYYRRTESSEVEVLVQNGKVVSSRSAY
jgi:hypothetical protein